MDLAAPELFIPNEFRPVWIALQAHVGRDNAISQADLAEAAGTGPRQVREAINRLIVNCRRRICSRYGAAGQAGYFLPADEKEALAASEALKRHALRILRRAAVLEKISVDLTLASLTRLDKEEAGE